MSTSGFIVGTQIVKTICAPPYTSGAMVLEAIRSFRSRRIRVDFSGWSFNSERILCAKGTLHVLVPGPRTRRFELELKQTLVREGLYLAQGDRFTVNEKICPMGKTESMAITTGTELPSQKQAREMAIEILNTWVIGGKEWLEAQRERVAEARSRRHHRRESMRRLKSSATNRGQFKTLALY